MTSMYANLSSAEQADPNQAVVDLVVVSGSAGSGAPAWTDITGKPSTFTPTTGTTAGTAAAGNDSRLTADQAAGTASPRTLGTGAQQAAAGNHTHTGLLTGSATAVNGTTATDVAGLVTFLNSTVLPALRARGIITGS